MKTMDVNSLRTLMVECMGADVAEQFEGEQFLETSFGDLDFDSLARVELAEQLKEWTELELPNDFVDQAADPGDLLRRVNEAVRGAAQSALEA